MDCIQSPECWGVYFVGQRQRQHRGLHNQWDRKGKGASGSNDCLYMARTCGCCGFSGFLWFSGRVLWHSVAPVVRLQWLPDFSLTCALGRRPHRRSSASRTDCPAPPCCRDRTLGRRHRRRPGWPYCPDPPPLRSPPGAAARATVRAWPMGYTQPDPAQSPCCPAGSTSADWAWVSERGRLSGCCRFFGCFEFESSVAEFTTDKWIIG